MPEQVGTALLARSLGEPVGRVAYHLKTLVACGVLEAGDEEPSPRLYGWADEIDPAWMRLLLEVWPPSDPPGPES